MVFHDHGQGARHERPRTCHGESNTRERDARAPRRRRSSPPARWRYPPHQLEPEPLAPRPSRPARTSIPHSTAERRAAQHHDHARGNRQKNRSAPSSATHHHGAASTRSGHPAGKSTARAGCPARFSITTFDRMMASATPPISIRIRFTPAACETDVVCRWSRRRCHRMAWRRTAISARKDQQRRERQPPARFLAIGARSRTP